MKKNIILGTIATMLLTTGSSFAASVRPNNLEKVGCGHSSRSVYVCIYKSKNTGHGYVASTFFRGETKTQIAKVENATPRNMLGSSIINYSIYDLSLTQAGRAEEILVQTFSVRTPVVPNPNKSTVVVIDSNGEEGVEFEISK